MRILFPVSILREQSFLIPGTRAEGIFEELKKLLSLGTIWQKVLVTQHDLLKSFGNPITNIKMLPKVFVPLLQLYNSFRTPDIEQKKFQRV